MSIKNRGNIKWNSSFMMPEHMKLLRKAWKDDEKVERPLIDENAIEEMEQTICEAIEENAQLKFTTWKNGYFNFTIGCVQYVDSKNSTFRIFEPENTLKLIPFYDVIKVEKIS